MVVTSGPLLCEYSAMKKIVLIEDDSDLYSLIQYNL